ncbi:MAG: MFS transporter [Burkholderiales bacterium]|nr:MFS transporter [Burkholderiales bacterium]
MAFPDKIYYGWRVVAACFVIATFSWGLGLYGVSVYLHGITVERGWSVSAVSAAITLFFLCSALLQAMVGALIQRHGPRPVITGGALVLATGVALVGFVQAYWQLYFVFLLMGVSWASLSVTSMSSTVAPWFERRQGLSITIAMMGASIGAIVVAPLLLAGVTRFGLAHSGLVASALVLLVILPLAVSVLRHARPQALGLAPDGAAAVMPPAGAAHVHAPQRTWTRSQALRSPAWRSVTLAFALAFTVQIGVITHHVKLLEGPLGAAGAGWVVSATGLTALCGRLLLARIVDRVDGRKLAAAILSLQTLALFAMSLWLVAPVLVAASILYGFGIGITTTMGPVIVRREFGAASFGLVYGMAATLIQLISAAGPAIFGTLRDAFGSYGPALALAGVLNIVALLAVLHGRGRRDG